jgi:hypothetical protein
MDDIENFIEFEFDIQEVAGKHVVNRYLDEVVAKCKALDLFCEIEIGNPRTLQTGGQGKGTEDKKEESTFPFNLFEKAADRVSGVSTKDVDKKGAGIFDRLFSFLLPKREEPLSEAAETPAPIVEQEKKEEIDVSYKSSLQDITDVVHVSVQIYDASIDKNTCGGSLYDFENWLQEKEKLRGHVF